MIIRPETNADIKDIRDINVAAFAVHPYSHQTEHLIVEALRSADALTLSLVAEMDDGRVVGHIAFSHGEVNGIDCGWFVIGPLAVLPDLQRQGIGQALMREGLKRMRDLGARGCVLVGDPAYYCRFGFESMPELQMEGVPPEFVLSLPMDSEIPQGNVTHHPAFLVEAPDVQ
jgi:putative acetyltransferase